MADQFLQTLTPEAQAQYDAAERKKQIALMMMKANPEGLQPMKLGTIASRVHPLAFIADAASKHFAGKEFEKSADAQGKLKTEGAANYSGAVNDFMGQNGPSGDPSAIARLLTNPSPAVQQFGKDTQSKMAAAAEKEAERLLKAKEAAAKILGDYGDPAGALGVFNNGIPRDYKPPQMPEPEIRSTPGPNGQPVSYALTTNRKGEKSIHNLGGGVNVSVDNKLAGKEGELSLAREQKDLDDQRTLAQTAMNNLGVASRITNLIRDGASAGGLTTPIQMARKFAEPFGIKIPETGMTDELRGQLGEALLNRAKALGSNPSNADAERINQIVGSIDTDPQALVKLQAVITAKAHKDLADFQQFVGVKRQGKNASLYDTVDIGIRQPDQVAGTLPNKILVAQHMMQQGMDPAQISKLTGLRMEDLPPVDAEMGFSQKSLTGGSHLNPKNPVASPGQAPIQGLSPEEQKRLLELRKKYGRG